MPCLEQHRHSHGVVCLSRLHRPKNTIKSPQSMYFLEQNWILQQFLKGSSTRWTFGAACRASLRLQSPAFDRPRSQTVGGYLALPLLWRGLCISLGIAIWWWTALAEPQLYLPPNGIPHHPNLGEEDFPSFFLPSFFPSVFFPFFLSLFPSLFLSSFPPSFEAMSAAHHHHRGRRCFATLLQSSKLHLFTEPFLLLQKE